MDTPRRTDITDDGLAQLDRFANQSLMQPNESETIAEMPPFLQRSAVYAVAAAVLITVALLYFGKVHVVVTAKGRLIPEGDVIPVQAIQGGMANAVLARAGDRLRAGAPILKLDVSESGVNLAELERQHALDQSRLDLLRTSVDEVDRILLNPETASAGKIASVSGNAGQLVSALENARLKREGARFETARLPERTQMQTREIELTKENIALSEKNHQEQKGLIEGETQALEKKRVQLNSYRQLAEKKLLSPLELSREEESYRAAEGALLSARQRFDQQAIDISNQRLHLAELQGKLVTNRTETNNVSRLSEMTVQQALAALRQEKSNLSNQIRELEATVATSGEKVKLARAKVSLSTITMPVSGTIVESKVNNAGEIVSSGTIVVSIAPDGVPLIVETSVPNKDVGFLKPGLEARVKVEAYPYQQFGTAPARVLQVLPSVGKDANFTVRLRLLTSHLQSTSGTLELFPGLTVEADIRTAEQRLFKLLFAKDSGEKKSEK